MNRNFFKTYSSILLALLLASSLPSLLAASAGRVQGEFLRIGINGRAAGMGEAFCAVADNASAVYWNPAGVAQLKQKEFSAAYTNLLGAIRIANLVYAQPKGESAGFGIEVNTLYIEDIRRDAVTGEQTGTFLNYNASLALAYSKSLSENLLVGAGLKALQFKLDTESASGAALDLGALYKMGEKTKAGLVLQNLGTAVQFAGDESAPLATNIKAGVSVQLGTKLLVASDINKPLSGSWSLSVGGEYTLSNILGLRCGYKLREGGNNLGSLDGISIGLGMNIKSFSFDYALVPYGDFERMNRITLSMKF